MVDDLPIMTFPDIPELRSWLEEHHATSSGVWVRLAKAGSHQQSVTFLDLLEEGLCFGWSESTRRAGDATCYLQKFTPRRTPGTTSARNKRLAHELQQNGRMTAAGLSALGPLGWLISSDRKAPGRGDTPRRDNAGPPEGPAR